MKIFNTGSDSRVDDKNENLIGEFEKREGTKVGKSEKKDINENNYKKDNVGLEKKDTNLESRLIEVEEKKKEVSVFKSTKLTELTTKELQKAIEGSIENGEVEDALTGLMLIAVKPEAKDLVKDLVGTLIKSDVIFKEGDVKLVRQLCRILTSGKKDEAKMDLAYELSQKVTNDSVEDFKGDEAKLTEYYHEVISRAATSEFIIEAMIKKNVPEELRDDVLLLFVVNNLFVSCEGGELSDEAKRAFPLLKTEHFLRNVKDKSKVNHFIGSQSNQVVNSIIKLLIYTGNLKEAFDLSTQVKEDKFYPQIADMKIKAFKKSQEGELKLKKEAVEKENIEKEKLSDEEGDIDPLILKFQNRKKVETKEIKTQKQTDLGKNVEKRKVEIYNKALEYATVGVKGIFLSSVGRKYVKEHVDSKLKEEGAKAAIYSDLANELVNNVKWVKELGVDKVAQRALSFAVWAGEKNPEVMASVVKQLIEVHKMSADDIIKLVEGDEELKSQTDVILLEVLRHYGAKGSFDLVLKVYQKLGDEVKLKEGKKVIIDCIGGFIKGGKLKMALQLVGLMNNEDQKQLRASLYEGILLAAVKLSDYSVNDVGVVVKAIMKAGYDLSNMPSGKNLFEESIKVIGFDDEVKVG